MSVQIGRPMAVVGTSLGGAVAIDFAAAHPEAVDKLVLFAPQVNPFLDTVFGKALCQEFAAQYLPSVHIFYDGPQLLMSCCS